MLVAAEARRHTHPLKFAPPVGAPDTAAPLLPLQGQDLASGNITGPVLFALQSPDGRELAALVDSDFQEAGGLQRAIDLVKQGGGLADAKALAQQEADLVRTCGSS